jgi:hypothetical protein
MDLLPVGHTLEGIISIHLFNNRKDRMMMVHYYLEALCRPTVLKITDIDGIPLSEVINPKDVDVTAVKSCDVKPQPFE